MGELGKAGKKFKMYLRISAYYVKQKNEVGEDIFIHHVEYDGVIAWIGYVSCV